ncbi:hypothetical protein [Rickettsiella endosymbiont of Rhagonycha lignosa]|uniref:hypothetical protein n=1 Tax=Rickettsiella endosymbiont of Rhagonycha lignosa TaxID=3077937 RepID=UPI00313EEECD
MSKRRNRAIEQQQPPTVEQLAELETYIDTINVLATRINRSTLGGFLSFILITKFWPIHKFVFNYWLVLLNPLLTCFNELFNYLAQKSDKNYKSITLSSEVDTSLHNDFTLNIEDYLLMFSLFVLMNKYIATPLFFKFFPQLFYGTNSPHALLLREPQRLLTRNEAVEALQDLKKIKQNLQNTRKLLYFLFYSGTLAFCLRRYFNNQVTDANLHAFHLVFNIYNNIVDCLHQRQLEHKKSKIMQIGRQSLNTLSHEIGLPDWNRINIDNTGVYYFHLNIFRRNTRREHKLFEGIPISRLIKELVCVLCKYEHVKITAYNKHEVVLFFTKLLSDIQINEITTSYISRLQNIKNKYKLMCQLAELFSSIQIKPEYEIQEINKNDLVTRYNFIIQLVNIPNVLKEEMCKLLINCFSDNFSVQIKEDIMTITQVTAIDQLRHEEALKFLKGWFATYQPYSVRSVNEITASSFAKTKKTSNAAFFPRTTKKIWSNINKKSALFTPAQLHLSEHYTWRSGTYSGSKDGAIVKISGAYNLFSQFKLKHDDFPRCQENAYDHFKDIIITNARIVPKKDRQGIISTRTPVKDTHGIWFISKYKAKALGAHGNIRVYAKQENDDQGHVLLIFNTVKLRSH